MPPEARTAIRCSRCGREDSVPFAPTPGRPIYCRDCFARGEVVVREARPTAPRRRMLARARKGHFVHDALVALGDEVDMDERSRRMFVEMVFTRGSRQTTAAALEFLREKQAQGELSAEANERLSGLVERYSASR